MLRNQQVETHRRLEMHKQGSRVIVRIDTTGSLCTPAKHKGLYQRRQSGFKTSGVVDPGLKTAGVVGPKSSTDEGA